MRRSGALRSVRIAGATGLLTLALAGCGPHSLGFGHNGFRQGVPMAPAGAAWGAVDLDNGTATPVALNSLRLTGLRNATMSHQRVIRVTPGNGFSWNYPPLPAAMQAELAHSVPLHGFTLPAHSKDRYEAVFLMTAKDQEEDASSRAVVVAYRSGSLPWTETRHSGFCLYTRSGTGCDAE